MKRSTQNSIVHQMRFIGIECFVFEGRRGGARGQKSGNGDVNGSDNGDGIDSGKC